MKRWLGRVLGIVIVLLSATLWAQEVSGPEIPFDAADILQVSPEAYLGEAAGVALNSRGHVFVYTRTAAHGAPLGPTRSAQLFEYGPDGKFIREIGRNLPSEARAHSVRVDKADNIWTVDNLGGTVVKFNAAGKFLMFLGRGASSLYSAGAGGPRGNVAAVGRQGRGRGEILPGALAPTPAQPGRFTEPNDVAWDSAGNIYVADGPEANATARDSRVVKFDADGNFLKSWGGTGNAPGQFVTAHAIAVDANDNVYVADRGNNRVQVFDTDGKFLRMFKFDVPFPEGFVPTLVNYGKTPSGEYKTFWPNTLCITPGPNQALFISDIVPGRLYKFSLTGKLLGYLGSTGKKLGQFAEIHGIACPSEREVWIADLVNWRVQKLALRP